MSIDDVDKFEQKKRKKLKLLTKKHLVDTFEQKK